MVNDLRPYLAGRTIEVADLRFPAIVRHPEPELFRDGVTGRQIDSLTRRGKYILIHLRAAEDQPPSSGPTAVADADPELFVVHLGMTGQLRYVEAVTPLVDHTHAVFTLDDGRQLRYRDSRRFGRLLFGSEAGLVAARKLPMLGPEPLDPAYLPSDLGRRLEGRRAPLKALLLDQSIVAGVGNIYADEACFRARVRPDRPAGSLSRPAVARLHGALRDSLEMGIQNRGSSVDSYRDAWGNRGTQQENLQVYGRGGRPCFSCGRPLTLVRLVGRATVYCARCQR